MRFLYNLKLILFVCASQGLCAQDDFTQLVIDKKEHRAYLLTWPEFGQKPKVLQRFDIGLGRQEGDKEREGDLKTPEGIYFTTSSHQTNYDFKKYGPLAITLNYPNSMDHAFNKTGSGIWLHGVGLERRLEDKLITEGCVAFKNDEIVQLKHWLAPWRSAVVIANGLSDVNIPSNLESVTTQAKQWITAWSQRNLNQYASFYSKDFVNPKGKYEQYIAYKKSVFNRYKSMTVDMQNLRVIAHPKYAITIMSQYFKGDEHLVSKGIKLLYWQEQADKSWQIVREDFIESQFEPLPIDRIANSSLIPAAQPAGETY